MGGQSDTPRVSLIDLVEPPRWQRLQDHFASVLGAPIRTISPAHELLVNPSWPAGLEPERTVKLLKIGEEIQQLIPLDRPPHETSSLTTPLGITYATVPVRATPDQATAYYIIGPMVVGPREDELQFRRRVGAMKLDVQSLWPLILSLKLYTFVGVRSALTLLEEVGTSIAQLAYQARELATILPRTSKVDDAVVAYQTNRILSSLLEVATLATKADGGSIMVYDGRRDVLQIQVAQGLSDAVMTQTRLRRGQGIAGLAAAQRQILLIDDHTTDERLKTRMSRSELVSSLVAPLTQDDVSEPIGVLSLRTTNSQRRFTGEHVELLRRLLDLAGAALGSLRGVFTHTRPVSS